MKLTHTNRDRTDRKHLYSVWLFRIIYDPDLFLQVWIFFRERDVAAQCVITGANLAKFKSAVKPGKKKLGTGFKSHVVKPALNCILSLYSYIYI